jgi:cytidine deaminase
MFDESGAEVAENVRSIEYCIGRRELLLSFASTLGAVAAARRARADSAQKTPMDPLSELLPGWSDASRTLVQNRLIKPGATGRISADDVAALARTESRTVENLMVEMLAVARQFSRPPISNFKVGAVALGASGALYPGANIEMPGNGLNQAVHAEQSALANAYGHAERGITAIAVTAAPCGHCRQFMNEITGGSKIRVIVKGSAAQTLEELLPASFGPGDLGIAAGLFSSSAAKIRLVSGTGDALAAAALDAAARAYAPHTKAISGCSVRTKSGKTYAGSYLENAAFNPSLSPLQAALVNVVFAGEELGAITRVALVEMRGAVISQRPATEAVLRAIAPSARLDVFTGR